MKSCIVARENRARGEESSYLPNVLPDEIWLAIFKKLPLKSQVSLGCSCRKLYEISVDRFLDNTEERALLYLTWGLAIPFRLARSVRHLTLSGRVSHLDSALLKKQILRMECLRILVLERAVVTASHIHELVQGLLVYQNLQELNLHPSLLQCRDAFNRNFLHYAVAQGNRQVAVSLLSQGIEINAEDKQGNTPLQLAIQRGDRELIDLLYQKGGVGKKISLEKKLFSSQTLRTLTTPVDYPTHITVSYLAKRHLPLFLPLVAENRHIFSLSFTPGFFSYFKGKDAIACFFGDLAHALNRRNEPLKLDLGMCTLIEVDQVKSLVSCRRLEELKLPLSLLERREGANGILLTSLLTQAISVGNIPLVKGLCLQGVALISPYAREDLFQLAQTLGDTESLDLLEKTIKIEEISFGRRAWLQYFGEVGVEPSLPPRIFEILQSPCPVWPGEKVMDTHLLVLIPQTVKGRALTLSYLRELIQHPKEGGHATAYHLCHEKEKYTKKLLEDISPDLSQSSYWVLMTKNVLPNTRDKLYSEQRKEFGRQMTLSEERIDLGYRMPRVLEAAVCIATEYVRRGVQLYKRASYLDEISTYTRCEEELAQGRMRIMVGAFADYRPSPCEFCFGIVALHPCYFRICVGYSYFQDRNRSLGMAALRPLK